jgi:hypothetical protein
LVPETSKEFLARNWQYVNLVPEKSQNFSARNRHNGDSVPGWLLPPPKVRDGAKDGIERGVQMFP